jgi:uroporphyrinogen decarboxylase
MTSREKIGRVFGKVMVHSCGAVREIIPMLIEAGMDGLHPLQARAAGMDAVSLAREYQRDLVFIGGVDTQDLLVHATPGQVKDEVRRLRDLLGPSYIVSPSHEAILPDVPLANVIAMAEAARE